MASLASRTYAIASFKSKHRSTRSGFSLVQLMVASLILSSLSIMAAKATKNQSRTLGSADAANSTQGAGAELRRLLADDLKQAVFLNPACDTNAPNATATETCGSIPIRGGITPLPGKLKSDLDSETSFGLPSNLTSTVSSLSQSSDAIRILQYNFTGTSFNCKLSTLRSPNPSTTAGTATGAERLWLQGSGCRGNLAVGGLYIIIDSFTVGGVASAYSNLLQITALSDLSPGSDELQIDAASTSNKYNQAGGLGLSAYTSSARIYPVKFVEWAMVTDGLYRREIKPSAGDLTGFKTWVKMEKMAEGIQFYLWTVDAAGPKIHRRVMSFSGIATDAGVQSIRAVTPHFVIKSSRQNTEGKTYSNPLNSFQPADSYPRFEYQFFVNLKNAPRNGS